MSDNPKFSEWLVRTAIGLVFAGVGFVARDSYREHQEWKKKQVASLESLKAFSTLLDESKSIFENQNYQARRLASLLQSNHPHELSERCAGKPCGFDERFFLLFDVFTQEEAELQSLIRSTTENSQRRVNESMSQWLTESPAFTAQEQPGPTREKLAEQLRLLRQHLNQWHDKYQKWIPPEPKHTLVYLADEKVHGVGFPTGIEEVVGEAIASWQ